MNSNNSKFNILQPTYYRKFQCDPTKCLETCCDRWKITIDKNTYQKYVDCENTTIKKIVATGLTKNEKSSSDEAFGVINLKKDLECPFLNKEGYCEIIINIGENYLSKTCKNYPRVTFKINNDIERGLQMSCSVATELALLNKNKMEFEKVLNTINLNDTSINSINIDHANMKIYNEIRTFVIEILQNRKIGLNKRVSMIGSFLNQILTNKDFPNLDYKKILSLINETRKSFNKADFTSKFKGHYVSYENQFNILNSILSMKFKENNGIAFPSKRYIECLWQVLDAFENANDENIASYYKENYEKYLNPYLDEKEFILENFLVNYVFIYHEELFKLEEIWNFYIKLCVIYGLFKFNLIGLATYHKGMTDELVLKLIQSLSKTIIPDNNYLKSVINYLKETKTTDLSNLKTLFML